MNINKYYKKSAKAYIIIGVIQLSVALILLYFYLTANDSETALDLLFSMIMCFIGGTAFFIFGIAQRKWSKTKFRKNNLSSNEEDFFQASRLMLIPYVHWLREYEYFSLNGNSVARIREDVEGWRKFITFLLHLIGLRHFLKKSFIVENGEKTLFYLEKSRGFTQYFEIFNAEKVLIASYKMNIFNPVKQYAVIHDEKGNIIGKNDGGFSAQNFKVINNNGDKVIELKYQGIPMEAMETFSGTNGDIVDFNFHVLPEREVPKFILAPVIIQLHFR